MTPRKATTRAQRASALAMLETWISTPYFTENFEDPDQIWKNQVLDPAKNGELRRMKSEHWNYPKPG